MSLRLLPSTPAVRMEVLRELVEMNLLVPVVYSRWLDPIVRFFAPAKYRMRKTMLENDIIEELLTRPVPRRSAGW